MKTQQNIQTMLAARFPLLYIVSPEEETVEEELVAIAKARKSQIYFWDFSRGWLDQDGADKGNPKPGSSRLEGWLRQKSILLEKEVLNPQLLERGFGLPLDWTSPLELRRATELLERDDQL